MLDSSLRHASLLRRMTCGCGARKHAVALLYARFSGGRLVASLYCRQQLLASAAHVGIQEGSDCLHEDIIEQSVASDEHCAGGGGAARLQAMAGGLLTQVARRKRQRHLLPVVRAVFRLCTQLEWAV